MTKINFTKSILLFICLLGFAKAEAQFSQTGKIVSDNRESRAEYGTSVAITQDYAIVGASRETIASGAAYVYNKDGQGNWAYAQRLAATDPNEGAEYGGGVKFSEDFLVVAAGRANIDAVQRAGALYVYDHINNNWEFSTKLVAADFSDDAKLGMNPTSLDVAGNTIVAGAPGDNLWTGSVYVFTKVGGVWTETQKIFSPTPQASDVFGIGVSISGDYLVIGANEVAGRKGAAYVYLKNSNGQYEYVQTLMASDAANDDFFGTSVSIASDQMVVGAYGANAEQGAAYVFERNGQGVWEEVQKLVGNPSGEGTQFGWSTDIQQSHIIVSAPHIFGFEAGEIYHYKREGSGSWEENQIIQGADTVEEDFYGWSIAMHETQLIAGAPWEDHDENGGNEIDRAGSAYIFSDPALLGVSQYGNTDSLVQLFPNPSSGLVNLKSNTKTIADLEIYGMAGNLLQNFESIKQNFYSINISDFSTGVYFVRIHFEDGSSTNHKIVKSN